MDPETAVGVFLAEHPDLYGQQLVLAVSGGADSVALAAAMATVAPHRGLRLCIAHLDHALRPDSAQEVLLVRRLAEQLGLDVIAERRDVPAYARAHRQSVEAAARAVRYAFLAEVVRRVGAVAVATGHTADDQAETVLLRLIRGAGPLGLAGMRPDRTLAVAGGAVRVLRPLLGVARAATRAYCAAHGLAYLEDPSNVDLRFARNRVRQEVLPVLERLNPAVREALCRTSAAAADLADLVAAEAEDAWQRLTRVVPGGVGFAVSGLRAERRPIQVALLERAAATLSGGEPLDLSASHLEAAVSLLAGDGALREVHWPGRLRVQRVGPELWVGARPTPPALPEAGYELSVPGEVVLPSGARIVARLQADPCPMAQSRLHVDVPLAAIGERLTVRRPRPGDRLRPRGLGGTKKVQDLLTDAKVPRPDRAAVPVVVGLGGPFWVVGFAVDERASAGGELPDEVPRPAGGGRAGAAAQPVVCLQYIGTERYAEPTEVIDGVEVLLPAAAIQARVRDLATQISADYSGRPLLLVGVLKGALMFMADLARSITVPVALDFLAVSSYGASTTSSGVVRLIKDLDSSIEGWDVLLVEDIVDTGLTLGYTTALLRARGPRSLAICALLRKQKRRQVEPELAYVGFDIPDRFVVGYGLDAEERYRNLPFIGVLRAPSRLT